LSQRKNSTLENELLKTALFIIGALISLTTQQAMQWCFLSSVPPYCTARDVNYAYRCDNGFINAFQNLQKPLNKFCGSTITPNPKISY
jgi:hypothetical protein